MYCKHCGKEIDDNAKFCSYCGNSTRQEEAETEVVHSFSGSSYSRGLALIFACLGCVFISGVHRFYVGKIGTGILWLLSGGCLGIGTLIDIIMIAKGTFEDVDGHRLTKWEID